MKIAALFAWFVPEVRKLSGGQLLAAWAGVTGWSRNKIYLHLLLLLACCSLLFNGAMRLGGGFFLDLFGLLIGLTVPANVYFASVLGRRRPQLRQFIEENWEQFKG